MYVYLNQVGFMIFIRHEICIRIVSLEISKDILNKYEDGQINHIDLTDTLMELSVLLLHAFQYIII